MHVDEFKNCLNAFFEERKSARSPPGPAVPIAAPVYQPHLPDNRNTFVPWEREQTMPMPYISGLESGGEWRQVYWSATNHNSPMQSSDGAGARRNIAALGAHHPPAAATAPHAPNDGPNIDPLSPIAAGMEFSGKCGVKQTPSTRHNREHIVRHL